MSFRQCKRMSIFHESQMCKAVGQFQAISCEQGRLRMLLTVRRRREVSFLLDIYTHGDGSPIHSATPLP